MIESSYKLFIKNTFHIVWLVFLLGSCTSDISNMEVASIFDHGMVLQQNQKLPVWGTASPGTQVKVQLNTDKKATITDRLGVWKVVLPKQSLGDPTELKISSKDTTIVFTDVLIGEVWLASGQSNMHLDMARTLHGKENALKANNPIIRIYNMKPTYPTGENGTHTLEELEKIQNYKYFNTNGWVDANPESIKNFSAVAYYFAEKMQKELGVPVGIIHNAVPGSPTESWVSYWDLKDDAELSKLIKTNWKDNEKNGVGKVLLDIAKNQISKTKDSLQMHPWMPWYSNYTGIKPINQFAIKGVIWYQGESNVGNIPLHEKLLKKMVATWRTNWHQETFPFYYVQLTSREDRPTWPAFRDSQRKLAGEISNSGMVVISDIGDRQDTHAKQKKPVGERLALLALGKTYHKTKNYESPMFDKVSVADEIIITFKGAFTKLQTKNKKPVVGFEIGIEDKFSTINAIIKGKTIHIKVPKQYHKNTVVRYAWKAFSEANLYNEIGLPVSTFKTNIYESN